MHLDIITLVVVTVFINAMAGGLMIFSWLHSRDVVALLYWGAAYLCGAMALALVGGRGAIPDVWSIVIANATLLAGFGLTWAGVRSFDRRPVKPWQIVAGSLAWFVACSIPAFYASVAARVLLGSLIGAAYTCVIVIDLWRGRHDRLMSRWLAVAIIGLHGLVVLARAPATWLTLPPDGGLMQLKWLPISMFESLFFSFGAAFILLTMAKERAELRHKRAAFIDPLTGVPNRRGFLERAGEVLARCHETGAPVTLLLFDLDHFKRVNDTFGHQLGDDTLVSFCRTAQARLGPEDVFARLGGEEFVCLVPEERSAAVYALAERIRGDFETGNRIIRGREVGATVSVGIADSVEAGRDLTALLGAADKALYRAKAKGRNRVEGRQPKLAVVAGQAMAPLPRGAA